eukprot:SAG11_NODE_2163_length_3728_cov_19.144944_5_plen_65_part_00
MFVTSHACDADTVPTRVDRERDACGDLSEIIQLQKKHGDFHEAPDFDIVCDFDIHPVCLAVGAP